MIDGWLEALDTLLGARARSLITAASVGWGIFMFVVLMGAGRGLENSLAWQFRDDAINSIWIWPGETSRPFKGLGPGRSVSFRDADVEAIRRVPGVEHLSARFYPGGDMVARYGDRSAAFSVRATHPDHQHIENTLITEGRFINALDLAGRRKVAVIGGEVARFLLRGDPALGAPLDLNGLRYTVVGVFEDVGGDSEMRQIYIPITTAQAAYAGGDTVHQLLFTVGELGVAEAAVLGERVRRILAEQHGFDPGDPSALRVRNNLERFQRVSQVLDWLGAFILLVGLGTVAAGAIGVGNVMLISVKERTRELGLRKALGASPGALVALVMREALTLTLVGGLGGLVTGVALVELVREHVPENDTLRDPSVDLGAALAATALLVVAGSVAGLVPALRAASVDPIRALRDG